MDLKEAEKIMQKYTKTLETLEATDKIHGYYPISMLPYSKKDIKNAIKLMLFSNFDNKVYIDLLKTSFVILSSFLPDYEAEMVEENLKSIIPDEKILKNTSNEKILEMLSKDHPNMNSVHEITEKVSIESSQLLSEIDRYYSQLEILVGRKNNYKAIMFVCDALEYGK